MIRLKREECKKYTRQYIIHQTTTSIFFYHYDRDQIWGPVPILGSSMNVTNVATTESSGWNVPYIGSLGRKSETRWISIPWNNSRSSRPYCFITLNLHHIKITFQIMVIPTTNQFLLKYLILLPIHQAHSSTMHLKTVVLDFLAGRTWPHDNIVESIRQFKQDVATYPSLKLPALPFRWSYHSRPASNIST